jgi:amino acid permease
MWKNLFRKKSITQISSEIENNNELSRELPLISVIILGIGVIIGSGIFVITELWLLIMQVLQ